MIMKRAVLFRLLTLILVFVLTAFHAVSFAQQEQPVNPRPLSTAHRCIVTSRGTSNANIRLSPNTSAEIVGILTPQDTVIALARFNFGGEQWVNTPLGWIADSVLEYEGNCGGLIDLVIGAAAPAQFLYSPLIPLPDRVRLQSFQLCADRFPTRIMEYNPNGETIESLAAPAACDSSVAFGVSLLSSTGGRRLFFPPVDLTGILIGLNQPSLDPTGILIRLNQPIVDLNGIVTALNQSSVSQDSNPLWFALPGESLEGILIGLLRDAETESWGSPQDDSMILFETPFGARSYLWAFRHSGGANPLTWADLLFVMSWAHPESTAIDSRGRILIAYDVFDPNGAYDTFNGSAFVLNNYTPQSSSIGVCTSAGCVSFQD